MNRLYSLFLCGIASISFYGSEAAESDTHKKGSKRSRSTFSPKSTPQDIVDPESSLSSPKRLRPTPALVPDTPVQTPSVLNLSALVPSTWPYGLDPNLIPKSIILNHLTTLGLMQRVNRLELAQSMNVSRDEALKKDFEQLLQLINEQTTALNQLQAHIDADAKTKAATAADVARDLERHKQHSDTHEQSILALAAGRQTDKPLLETLTRQHVILLANSSGLVQLIGDQAQLGSQVSARVSTLEKDVASLKESERRREGHAQFL